MVFLEAQNDIITNEDVYDAFQSGRQLMQGCEIRPESSEDMPDERTEWRRGNATKTLFCQTFSENPEERAVTTWQYMVRMDE